MPISNEFVVRTDKGEPDLLGRVRAGFNTLGKILQENLPPSRELSVAITNLETASMWAMKAAAMKVASEKEA
jgi:hypothetical protein